MAPWPLPLRAPMVENDVTFHHTSYNPKDGLKFKRDVFN